ncbi:MAG: AbrB/MazE/SpoVT family DNA-binding domain-containing protein [Candidatus Bathyarchaeota archaeon]|nr:AbrB/MazE/SpoVT family DNA-binding domain-containing protein [Candidatus Bathyarchaeota archaeon]
MGERVKVLQKGKVTIPVAIRQRLGINEGDYVTLEIVDGKLVLLPPNTISNPTDYLTGLAEGVNIGEPVKQDLRKAAAERLKRKSSRVSK